MTERTAFIEAAASYSALFRATLPETALEFAALVVLVFDLGFLRKAASKTRIAAAALISIAGCAAALWAVCAGEWQGWFIDAGLSRPYLPLAAGGSAAVAQVAILVLTALTLLLFIDTGFTRNPGEYVSVVLMAAAGGMIVAAAQDLLVIFVGLELLSLGLYILTAFAKKSGQSAEAALKYYLFGGMSAAFLLFGFSYFYGLTGSTNLGVIEWTIAFSGATPLFYVAWVFVVVGLGFKIAAVPFQGGELRSTYYSKHAVARTEFHNRSGPRARDDPVLCRVADCGCCVDHRLCGLDALGKPCSIGAVECSALTRLFRDRPFRIYPHRPSGAPKSFRANGF